MGILDPPSYRKPSGGIPRTDLDSATSASLTRADNAAVGYAANGDPEGVISANPSSLFQSSDTGSLYYKSTGNSSTGWLPILPSGTIRVKARPNTGQDVTQAFTDAINQAASSATLSTTILLEQGEYLVTNITIPKNRTIIIQGMGSGYVGGNAGTRIKRFGNGTGSLLLATGDTNTLTPSQFNDPTYRCRIELYDLELNGNNTSGEVLTVYRGQQCNFERVRIRSSTGVGAHFTQMFNCTATKIYTGYCGGGDTVPAMLVDGTNEGTAAGTNTFHITDSEWETNAGTDLIVDGVSSSMSSVGIAITGAKMERNDGSFPLIRVGNAQIQLDNSYLYLGSSTTSHQIEINATGTVPTILSNIRLSHSGGPTYQIRQNSGALTIAGVHGEATVATAVLRVEAAIAIGATIARGLTGTNLNKLVSDARGITGRVGNIALTLPVTYTSATSSLVGTGAAGWVFSHGSSSPVCVGQVIMPSNIPQSAALSLVVRWIAKDTTTGNVALKAVIKDNTVSDDITTGGTTATATVAAPAVANKIVESGPSPGISTNPGHIVRVMFQRDGANASDTYTGDIVIVGVDLIVNCLP